MNSTLPLTVEGIIIRVQPYGEADLIIRAICRPGGKLSFFARSARRSKKRFGAGLDIFDHGTFEITPSRGDLYTIRSFTPAPAFRSLREELDAIIVAAVIAESFDYMIPEGEREENDEYTILSLGLASLNEANDRKELFRACHATLGSLLCSSGLLDREMMEQPSLKSLLSLIAQIEETAERPLKSKPECVALLEEFRSKQT